jgi:hypothetical protein
LAEKLARSRDRQLAGGMGEKKRGGERGAAGFMYPLGVPRASLRDHLAAQCRLIIGATAALVGLGAAMSGPRAHVRFDLGLPVRLRLSSCSKRTVKASYGWVDSAMLDTVPTDGLDTDTSA